MGKFLARIAILALLIAAAAAIMSITAFQARPKKKDFGGEVFRAIRVCTSHDPQARTLILGDSVAYQLFGVRLHDGHDDEHLDGVAVAACNQAITPLGNKILLDHWLSLNPQTQKVVYFAMPRSLANDGAKKYTFHYFVFPFKSAGLFDGGDCEDIVAHLAARFGSLPVKNVSFMNLLYRNEKLYGFYERHCIGKPDRDSGGGIPEMALKQLLAMHEACASRGIQFRLAFPPLSSRPSRKFIARLEEQLKDISPEVGASLSGLEIEPAGNFKDGVHFTRDRLLEVRGRIRSEVVGQ